MSGAALEYAKILVFVPVFLSRSRGACAHVWMVMDNQTLLGYLHFL